MTSAGYSWTDTATLRYLMNDFVVQENLCNLRCSYCLNFENTFKGTTPWEPPEDVDLEPGGKGFARARAVLDRWQAEAGAPILRISGGELLAIRGGVDFAIDQAGRWHRLQILTNATRLHGVVLERLAAVPNLNLCCSVDGHTPELNALRTANPRVAQRIIDGMLGAIRAGIPVEVNMVLTNRNIGALCDFAGYLLRLPRKADVRLMPFPVRGERTGHLGPRAEQLGALRDLNARYNEYREVLPPLGYLLRLQQFYEDGRRTFRCRIPLTFMQTFDDGVLASCSNCWAVSLGNVCEDDGVLEQVGTAKIHKLFLREPPRVPFCRACFTPFDVVNAYFDGACSLDELACMDLYSSTEVRRQLHMLHTHLREFPARALWRSSTRHEPP